MFGFIYFCQNWKRRTTSGPSLLMEMQGKSFISFFLQNSIQFVVSNVFVIRWITFRHGGVTTVMKLAKLFAEAVGVAS